VEKVTRKAKVGASEEKIETKLEQGVSENVKKEEDVDMSDDRDSKPKPKPRKKKEKKVIPVGRNGLKKRPVTKTRTIKRDDSWSMWHPFVYFTYRNNNSPADLGTQV
jgi:DNA polymerase delta subunit 3